MRRFTAAHALRLHVFLLWSLASGRRTDYTGEEIQLLLDLHNTYRARVNPPAANMMKLEWHDELASMAQDWADQCTFEHGQPDRDNPPFDDIGQNLNKFTSSDPDRLDSLYSRTYIALKTWWDEVIWYNFSRGLCSGPICGHYTQLVWARTQYLGCGYLNGSRCPGEFTYVVCNYGPTGNKGLKPMRPYIPGEPCSKCDTGHGWCEHGLCIKCNDQDCACPLKCKNCGALNIKTCTCACAEGWDYADCSEACENSNQTLCTQMHQANCALIQPEWCRAKCGHCTFHSKWPNREKCCGGKICHNRGYLDGDLCECVCQRGYYGNYCEISTGQKLRSNWILILLGLSFMMIINSNERKYLH
ncbi:cysteine-rich venom protein tigrin-like [Lissotriton helveticus]